MRRNMKLWKLGADASVRDVLTWCIEERSANRLLLTTRIDTDEPNRVLLEPRVDENARRILGPHVQRVTWATAWPVTQLIGHPGKVYVINLNKEVVTQMSDVQDRVFGWTQWNDPPLPEDLCAFRVGESLPTLVSITHEKDAWLLHETDPHVDSPHEVAWEDDLLQYISQRPDFLDEAPENAAITR
jgi:hypothetical protein